jgi:hypothetical protein
MFLVEIYQIRCLSGSKIAAHPVEKNHQLSICQLTRILYLGQE